MAISGFKIDYDKIAQGMLNEIFTEKDLAIIAHGMIPKDKLDMAVNAAIKRFEAPYREWAQRTVLERKPVMDEVGEVLFEFLGLRLDVEVEVSDLVKEAKKEFERELSKALYRNAEMVV